MESIIGFVEKIVFKSDDTGYVVAKVNFNNDTITAVGNIPLIFNIVLF